MALTQGHSNSGGHASQAVIPRGQVRIEGGYTSTALYSPVIPRGQVGNYREDTGGLYTTVAQLLLIQWSVCLGNPRPLECNPSTCNSNPRTMCKWSRAFQYGPSVIYDRTLIQCVSVISSRAFQALPVENALLTTVNLLYGKTGVYSDGGGRSTKAGDD